MYIIFMTEQQSWFRLRIQLFHSLCNCCSNSNCTLFGKFTIKFQHVPELYHSSKLRLFDSTKNANFPLFSLWKACNCSHLCQSFNLHTLGITCSTGKCPQKHLIYTDTFYPSRPFSFFSIYTCPLITKKGYWCGKNFLYLIWSVLHIFLFLYLDKVKKGRSPFEFSLPYPISFIWYI